MALVWREVLGGRAGQRAHRSKPATCRRRRSSAISSNSPAYWPSTPCRASGTHLGLVEMRAARAARSLSHGSVVLACLRQIVNCSIHEARPADRGEQGTPNRATAERAALRAHLGRGQMRGQKLGKEYLAKLCRTVRTMCRLRRLAAMWQVSSGGRWACATPRLAPYQSPTYRAVSSRPAEKPEMTQGHQLRFSPHRTAVRMATRRVGGATHSRPGAEPDLPGRNSPSRAVPQTSRSARRERPLRQLETAFQPLASAASRVASLRGATRRRQSDTPAKLIS